MASRALKNINTQDYDYYLSNVFEVYDVELKDVPENWARLDTPLRAHQALEEADTSLKKQKTKFEAAQRMLNVRKKEVLHKKSLLKESIDKYAVFLKEKADTSHYLWKKIDQDRKIQAEKKDEIEMLREKVDLLNQQISLVKKCLTKHQVARDFLQNFVGHSQEFSSVDAVVKKCTLMLDINKDLLAQQESCQKEIDATKVKRQKEEAHRRLQWLLSNAQREFMDSQPSGPRPPSPSDSKLILRPEPSELALAQMAIKNMYNQVHKATVAMARLVKAQRGWDVPAPYHHDMASQIIAITEYVKDWKANIEHYEATKAAERHSGMATHASDDSL